MAFKFFSWAPACCLAVLLHGCGGSDAPDEPQSPVTPPQSWTFELLTGSVEVDMDHCQSVNGAVESARYSRLLRTTVYADAVYLVETGEGCANTRYDAGGGVPVNVRPAIRKLAGGRVQTALALHDFEPGFMSYPPMPRYPSGFVRHEAGAGGYVLGYAAADSDRGFQLDAQQVGRYTELKLWHVFMPGLFGFSESRATDEGLVAGALGEPPALRDGDGLAAGFVAPHDLEVDASGLLYAIDEGRIRTIDPRAGHRVTTLDLAALDITGAVRALDADRQGRMHVLAHHGGGQYSWHQLSDGKKVAFQTHDFVMTEPFRTPSFTVVGDYMLMIARHPGGESILYRVSAHGVVEQLTGEEPGPVQKTYDIPSRHALPAVQHIEYGADGHLYIVLPQGVLVARDYEPRPD